MQYYCRYLINFRISQVLMPVLKAANVLTCVHKNMYNSSKKILAHALLVIYNVK